MMQHIILGPLGLHLITAVTGIDAVYDRGSRLFSSQIRSLAVQSHVKYANSKLIMGGVFKVENFKANTLFGH